MGKRDYGTGQLYVEFGSYYGRWRTLDGRKLNRKIGKAREKGSAEGLTRSEAERRFRRMQQEEEARPRPSSDERRTVDDATDSLRRKLKIEGCRTSYLQGTESMQRVHISPRIGSTPVDRVTRLQVEAVAVDMLEAGLAPKSVRNVITFLHSVFEHAIDKGGRRRTRCGERRVPSAAAPATPTRTFSS
jgi:hypothetical protein